MEISVEQYNKMAERLTELEYELDKSVKVIRCKDCKWYDKGENEVSTWSICTRTMGIKDSVIDTDYCSFAERIEGSECE